MILQLQHQCYEYSDFHFMRKDLKPVDKQIYTHLLFRFCILCNIKLIFMTMILLLYIFSVPISYNSSSLFLNLLLSSNDPFLLSPHAPPRFQSKHNFFLPLLFLILSFSTPLHTVTSPEQPFIYLNDVDLPKGRLFTSNLSEEKLPMKYLSEHVVFAQI